jgi:CubicO group peptidase (beta-lactamase class C family)
MRRRAYSSPMNRLRAFVALSLSPLACASTSPRPVQSPASAPLTTSLPIDVAPMIPPLPSAPRADLASLDPFIAEIMAAWKVPGLAVAVVQDDKVIFSKAYGYRDAEKKRPVTTKTLFGIGSITKSMTTASLGTLVDEAKLDWDVPVARYLPGFALHDPMSTEHATTRDLASHRSGVPDHWFLWYGADGLTRAELLSRLRYLEPNHELRTTFEYNTLMFVALGEMGARLADEKNAEAFVTDRLWKPLGMTQSDFSIHAMRKTPDYATPYRRVEGQIEPAPFHDQDVVGPAGGVNSNVEDMARYVAFQAGSGTVAGKTIVSPAVMHEIQRSQTTSLGFSNHPEVGEQTYGLGLYVQKYRGHAMVAHSGGMEGVGAHFAALPDDHIGVVVLNNLSFGDSMAPIVLTNTIVDRLLGLAPIDWQKIFYDQAVDGWKEGAEAAKRPILRHEGTKPSHPLEDFAGDFVNPAYGEARIEARGGTLRLVFHGAHALEHVHYDVFGVPRDPRDDFSLLRVVFATNAAGDVEAFSIPLEPQIKSIVFVRGPNRAMQDPTFLAPFIGEYDMNGGKWTLRIAARGKEAIVALPPDGSRVYLTPARGTTFAVDGRPGDTVDFGAGTITIHRSDGGSMSGTKKK